METLVTEIAIDATPERVWAALIDMPRYRDWNPFIVEAEGPVEVASPSSASHDTSRWSSGDAHSSGYGRRRRRDVGVGRQSWILCPLHWPAPVRVAPDGDGHASGAA